MLLISFIYNQYVMAKKSANSQGTLFKPANEPIGDGKETKFITVPITVSDQTSELKIKIDVNVANATWKVSGGITTKQVDPSNPEITEATLQRFASLIAQAVEVAMDRRAEILSAMDGNDPDQMSIGFGEPAGAGNR